MAYGRPGRGGFRGLGDICPAGFVLHPEGAVCIPETMPCLPAGTIGPLHVGQQYCGDVQAAVDVQTLGPVPGAPAAAAGAICVRPLFPFVGREMPMVEPSTGVVTGKTCRSVLAPAIPDGGPVAVGLTIASVFLMGLVLKRAVS